MKEWNGIQVICIFHGLDLLLLREITFIRYMILFLLDISNAWYSINTFRDLSHAYHSTPTFPHCTRSHTCNRIKHNTLEVIVTESCSFWPPWSKMKPWCIPCPCTRNNFFVYDPCIHLPVSMVYSFSSILKMFWLIDIQTKTKIKELNNYNRTFPIIQDLYILEDIHIKFNFYTILRKN